MSEHLPLRSSVGSRGFAPSSHHHHLPPHPRPHWDADPLASTSTPTRPRRGRLRRCRTLSTAAAPASATSAGARARCGTRQSAGGTPPQVAVGAARRCCRRSSASDVGEFAPVRPTIGFGSSSGSGGFPGSPSRTIVGGDSHDAWLAMRAAGSAYPSHAVDMVPIRMSHDLHARQHSMIPQNSARRAPSSSSMIAQNFVGHAPSSSSQQDEPFSYWNMGRFQRSTTTSSISQITVTPSNFVKKRNADSNNFLPMKFRKLSGAG